ncbi:MAG: hypothetical protein M3243_06440, partial [Thermoproteota archaeon]|nr:hypothetical protein [Thermoproteota archaeon]
MSKALYSKRAKINNKRVQQKQQCNELSSLSQSFDTKTTQGKKADCGQSKGIISFLAYKYSSLWFILSLLHTKVIFNYFIHQ